MVLASGKQTDAHEKCERNGNPRYIYVVRKLFSPTGDVTASVRVLSIPSVHKVMYRVPFSHRTSHKEDP